jgi:tripartite-type tricarboxylate transporter receptor subunit TctC
MNNIGRMAMIGRRMELRGTGLRNRGFRSMMTLTVAAASLGLTGAAGADPIEDFYKEKQLTILVGSEAGGGYDFPARVLARHIGRHIPGKPNILVRNMPGANGIVVANYMSARAPKDGSEIAIVHNTIVIDAMLGHEAVRFKPDEFVWLGSTSPLTNTCVVWHTAPVKTVEDARRTALRIGSTSATDATTIVPRFLNAFAGTRFNVVRGYPGTTAIYIAMERGEIDGVCAAWDSILKWRPDGLRSPDIRVLLQVNAKPDPSLTGVPFVMDLAQKPEDRETLAFLTARQYFARPFIAPPATSSDKVAVLRKAFMDTMRDPAFVADAVKTQIQVDPVDGESIQQFIATLLKTPKDIIQRANDATKPTP